MISPNCPHCGAKNCRRTHENVDVLNLDTKKKEKKDRYECRVCWKEHTQSPQLPTIKESDCVRAEELLSTHTTMM